MGQLAMRTLALIVGLVGSVLALVVNILYFVFQVLAQITGFSNDTTHFFAGIGLTLLGAIGSFLAPIFPIIAAVMLAAAGIGLFFVVGWWALIASPFLLVATLLTFSNRRVGVPGM